MAVKVKDMPNMPERLAGGHRACAGCTAPAAMRMILKAADNCELVCGCATGCMEVVTTIYPYTAWKIPFIHNAFENSAATVSGVEAAYRALKRKGKTNKNIKFIAFGGDGGTYDIGFQSLSGMLERGHNMLYVCYDNNAYMNTGIQRSGATPMGADTNTSQAGKVKQGKEQHRKDLTAIVIAHGIPYVAQSTPAHYQDLMNKTQKALEIEGPTFLNVLAPCHRGWRIPTEEGYDYARTAVETCFWPLFEVEYGKWKVNYVPKEKMPLVNWMQKQGRFKHLFKPGNEGILEKLQKETDRKWEELLRRAEADK